MKKELLFTIGVIMAAITICLCFGASPYIQKTFDIGSNTVTFIAVVTGIFAFDYLLKWYSFIKPLATVVIERGVNATRRIEITATNKNDYETVWTKYKEFIQTEKITRADGAVIYGIKGNHTSAEWFTAEDTERIKDFFASQNVVIKELKRVT